MKNYTSTSGYSLLLLCIIVLTSCGQLKNSKQYSASLAGESGTVAMQQQDIRFLFSAYNYNLFNAQLAKEAQIRSTSREAAFLADSIVATSEQANKQILAIAEDRGLTLPADIGQLQKQQWKELVKQKGWSFDEKYLAIMEQNLEALHALLTDAFHTVADDEIKQAASQALARLQTQGNMALALQEKIEARTKPNAIANGIEVAAQLSTKKK